MTAPLLRPAANGDVEPIASLWHDGWLDGHDGHVPAALHRHRRLDQFRRRVPGRLATTTVATDESGIVGFVTVRGDEIEQLYVAGPARGSGAADALLRHGEDVIAERFDVAWLAVVGGNTRARRFYGRNGWSDAGAIEYPAQTAAGSIPVASRRYEKGLR
jgi:GNAT superfamily N-acetyltransferase